MEILLQPILFVSSRKVMVEFMSHIVAFFYILAIKQLKCYFKKKGFAKCDAVAGERSFHISPIYRANVCVQ